MFTDNQAHEALQLFKIPEDQLNEEALRNIQLLKNRFVTDHIGVDIPPIVTDEAKTNIDKLSQMYQDDPDRFSDKQKADLEELQSFVNKPEVSLTQAENNTYKRLSPEESAIAFNSANQPSTDSVAPDSTPQVKPSLTEYLFEGTKDFFGYDKEMLSEGSRDAVTILENVYKDVLSLPTMPAQIAEEKVKQMKESGSLIGAMVEAGKIVPEFGMFFINSISDLLVSSRINPLATEEQVLEAQKRITENPVFTILGAMGAGRGLMKAAKAPAPNLTRQQKIEQNVQFPEETASSTAQRSLDAKNKVQPVLKPESKKPIEVVSEDELPKKVEVKETIEKPKEVPEVKVEPKAEVKTPEFTEKDRTTDAYEYGLKNIKTKEDIKNIKEKIVEYSDKFDKTKDPMAAHNKQLFSEALSAATDKQVVYKKGEFTEYSPHELFTQEVNKVKNRISEVTKGVEKAEIDPYKEMVLVDKELSEIITKKVGSGKPQDILDYYKKKYPELKNVELRLKDIDDPRGYDPYQGHFRGNREKQFIEGSEDITPATLRHEIEHGIDHLKRGIDLPKKYEQGYGETSQFSKYNHNKYLEEKLFEEKAKLKTKETESYKNVKVGDTITSGSAKSVVIEDRGSKLKIESSKGTFIVPKDKNIIIETPLEKKSVKSIEPELKNIIEKKEALKPGETQMSATLLPFEFKGKTKEFDGYEFKNKAIEQEYIDSHGIKTPSLAEKTREKIVDLRNKTMRGAFEFLPRGKRFAQLRNDLSKLNKQKDVSLDRSVNVIRSFVTGLKKKDYQIFERNVLLKDLNESVRKGAINEELPGMWTKKDVLSEYESIKKVNIPSINEGLELRKQVWNTLTDNYAEWSKKTGHDVGKSFTRDDYLHHQVLEYANAKGLTGTGAKLKTPAGRGFLKGREGSVKSINTNYLEAEYEVMSQMLYDIERMKVIDAVNKNENIYKKIKADYVKKLEAAARESGIDPEMVKFGMQENGIPVSAYENTLKSRLLEVDEKILKKKGLRSWESAIPEGYEIWQPEKGNVLYFTDTVPAKIANELIEGNIKELGITVDDLGKAFAVGAKKRQFVIPNEVANQLNNLVVDTKRGVIGELAADTQRAWKVWTLISPRRYFKYNFRNLSGDADAVWLGNPSGFKKMPKAITDLTDHFFSKRPMSQNLQDWFERGGMQSTLQFQELGDINKLDVFRKLNTKKESLTEKGINKTWKAYWKAARLSTDFREAILRYANYLDYLEKIENGKLKNYGASIKEEINAIKSPKDRAFNLSNDLLGAYDDVSIIGQELRKRWIPFWSWKEVNFKRYTRFYKNAAKDNQRASFIGKKFVGSLVKSPITLARIGKFAVKASALSAALMTWNQLKFKEEEDALPEYIKKTPHIILGRDENGKIVYFNRLGALGDFLDWFGVDDPPHIVRKYLDGKLSIKEAAVEMAKAPARVFVTGSRPDVKAVGEYLTGKSLFPDPFQPRSVRDAAEQIFRSFGLENEYRELKGIPTPGYAESISNAFIYKIDEGDAAYIDIYDDKKAFLKKVGKSGYSGGELTPKSNALYYFKKAMKYKDGEAAEKYLKEYISFGGNLRGLKKSLTTLHPLNGLNVVEKMGFVSFLDDKGREKLKTAIKFYEDQLK